MDTQLYKSEDTGLTNVHTQKSWIHLPDIHPTQAQVNSPALSDQLKAFQIGLG